MTNLRAYRVVLGFWLAAWFVNAPGKPGFIDNFVDAMAHPLRYEPFPALLTHPFVAFAVYLAPLVLVPVLWLRDVRLLRAGAFLATATSFFACLHLETCNDATFVTSFWVSLWLVWLSHNLARKTRSFLVIARGLAHGLVGLVFLGALVVKLTPEYQSGDVFYGIYFQPGTGWPYPWLKSTLSPEAYRSLANAFSRGALFAETMMAASPILPTRFVLPFFAALTIVMMIARNYNLFSVLGSLLGLLIAAELLRRAEHASEG